MRIIDICTVNMIINFTEDFVHSEHCLTINRIGALLINVLERKKRWGPVSNIVSSYTAFFKHCARC